MITSEITLHVGPAGVIRVQDNRVLVEVGGEKRWAAMALGYPYRPVPGDSLLVLGTDTLYVVGVLSGAGHTTLAVSGDLDLSATGMIRLKGGEGIDVEGKHVSIRADRLELWARTATERFTNCYRWVKEALQTRAGRIRTVVQGQHSLRAERLVHTARKDVKIDGTRIHLG